MQNTSINWILFMNTTIYELKKMVNRKQCFQQIKNYLNQK